MNNIEILENKLKLNEKTKFDWFGEKEFEAIENLIQENKDLKERINKSIEFINDDDTFLMMVKAGKMYFI